MEPNLENGNSSPPNSHSTSEVYVNEELEKGMQRFKNEIEGWNGEGGGFRMGNTCIPVADSFGYLAKLIQLCKV